MCWSAHLGVYVTGSIGYFPVPFCVFVIRVCFVLLFGIVWVTKLFMPASLQYPLLPLTASCLPALMGILFAHHNCGSPGTTKICHLCHVLAPLSLRDFSFYIKSTLASKYTQRERERESVLFRYICTAVEWLPLVKLLFVCSKLLIDWTPHCQFTFISQTKQQTHLSLKIYCLLSLLVSVNA